MAKNQSNGPTNEVLIVATMAAVAGAIIGITIAILI